MRNIAMLESLRCDKDVLEDLLSGDGLLFLYFKFPSCLCSKSTKADYKDQIDLDRLEK